MAIKFKYNSSLGIELPEAYLRIKELTIVNNSGVAICQLWGNSSMRYTNDPITDYDYYRYTFEVLDKAGNLYNEAYNAIMLEIPESEEV